MLIYLQIITLKTQKSGLDHCKKVQRLTPALKCPHMSQPTLAFFAVLLERINRDRFYSCHSILFFLSRDRLGTIHVEFFFFVGSKKNDKTLRVESEKKLNQF